MVTRRELTLAHKAALVEDARREALKQYYQEHITFMEDFYIACVMDTGIAEEIATYARTRLKR